MAGYRERLDMDDKHTYLTPLEAINLANHDRDPGTTATSCDDTLRVKIRSIKPGKIRIPNPDELDAPVGWYSIPKGDRR